MKLSNKTYDTLKWVLTIVVPALITALITAGQLYNFDVAMVTGTITLVSTFVGAIFMISSNNHEGDDK